MCQSLESLKKGRQAKMALELYKIYTFSNENLYLT